MGTVRTWPEVEKARSASWAGITLPAARTGPPGSLTMAGSGVAAGVGVGETGWLQAARRAASNRSNR